MQGFVEDIEEFSQENSEFRRVLQTGDHLQLVLTSLKPDEEIGDEVLADRDQFLRVERGKGQIVIDGTTHKIKSGDAMVVPSGAQRNIINIGDKSLKLDMLYGPPDHLDQLIQRTKAEATTSKEAFEGVTTK